jgi:acetylornithine deacetylase/succinyl-diaminopimelate desuccinylase-like protein
MDATMMSTLDRYLAAQRARHLDELMAFVAIPSVGADPEHRADMIRAADWVAAQLRAAGVPIVEAIPTAGHPVVWGSIPAVDSATPTVLIYGHYDTQPADERDGWSSPPFMPSIRDGRLYGRGASDDKGNLLIPIKAVEAYTATGTPLPVGVIFVIEGEEESGSANFPAFLADHRAQLMADVAISADSAMWSNETPSLMLGPRASSCRLTDPREPSSDLHSGLHGGMAPNPLTGLATLIAGMFNARGDVAIGGGYDAVRPLSAHERTEIAAVPFDETAYRELIDVDALVGESGYTTLERNWLRPTLDINGLWGGTRARAARR